MPALAKLLRRWWSAFSLPAFGRRCAAAAMVVLALGIVSGGAARLTGSGLSGSDWPTCT